jgi:hypothetical protein
MEPPSSLYKRGLRCRYKSQNALRVAFAAPNNLPDLGTEKVDHDNPARTDNMHVRRRMIVRIDYEPQAFNAQDSGHCSSLPQDRSNDTTSD